jgi:hypothetical protein
LIRGINYAISKHVDVINISMSVLLDDYPGDQGALEQVLGRADALGIVVCCSAGNTDAESLRWPAASEDVLACGVVRPDTTKASYSCYGAYVDFVAPGGNWEVEEYITTEYMAATKWSYPEPYWPEYLPPHTIVDESPITTGPVHTYKQTDGQTSGAAAQMSGVIALLKSRYPSYLKDDLVEELIRGAVPVDQYQLPQHQGKLGHGLLNPYRSMTEWGGPRASELQSGAVWRDSVWVSGDYTVPAGASLTIMPGTTVYVANFDNERAGDYPDVVEISGATVNAIGTPEAPIRFVTYGPAGIDTRSLVFGKRGSSEPGAVRLEHCEFADLEAFVVFGSTNAQADTTMVSNCTFVYPGSGELHYLRLGDAYLRACTFESGWTVFPYDNAHIEWCKFEHVPGESSPQPPIVFINSGRVFMANSIVRDAVVAIRTYPSPTDTLYLDDVLLEHACDPPEVDRGELGIDVQGGVVKAENLTVRGYTVGASLQGSGRFSAEYSTFTNCYQAALNNPSDNLMFFGYYVEPGSPLNKGGYNVFEDNTKNIANFHYSGTVQARLCWWGSPSGPPAKSNRGRVDTLFHLLANPNRPPPPDFLVLAEEPSPPFSVGRNYPNPFNPVTEFTISVPRGGGLVRAMVYDIRGRGVRRLLDRVLVSGEHRIEFNGKDDAGGALPSGMYLCRFNFRDREEVVKATLVK